MSYINFVRGELSAAVARGVRQFVVIGSRPVLRQIFDTTPDPIFQLFAVDEEQSSDSPATFVPTQFAYEPLPAALKKSNFDQSTASLFVWLGGAAYCSVDATMASLAFIASLPSGSGVVFDYAVERVSVASRTALHALASRIRLASGSVKHHIEPQAVAAMLRGLGFQSIVDLAQDERQVNGKHLITALV